MLWFLCAFVAAVSRGRAKERGAVAHRRGSGGGERKRRRRLGVVLRLVRKKKMSILHGPERTTKTKPATASFLHGLASTMGSSS